jgi:DNA gyrase/topoisomerase IV subunit A
VTVRGGTDKAHERLRNLDAALAALARRDELTQAISECSDRPEARARVSDLLSVAPEDADGVLDLRFFRLTHAEIERLEDERRSLLTSLQGD